MELTNRGAAVLVALSMLFVFACLVVGQEMKDSRVAQEQEAAR